MGFIRFLKRIFGEEAGNVLLLAVLSSAALIGASGFAVDYGMAVMQESKLQAATDLAALAGVQDLPFTNVSLARMQNYFMENYTRAGESTVQYDGDSASCWLTASHPVNTYFMRIFGRDTLTVHAQSKAVLENIEGFEGGIGVMPFVLINPNGNGNPNDDLNASNNGQPFILKYSSDNIMVDDWFYGRQIVQPLVIHMEGGSIRDAGWRSILALDPDSMDPQTNSNSGADFNLNFAQGWKGHIEIGDILDSNPGVMTGPTVQARNDRLDGNNTQWSTFDANLDPTNSRILVVPVVTLGYYDGLGVWHAASDQQIIDGTYDWMHSRVDSFAAFYLLSDTEQMALPGGNYLDRKWVVGRYLYGVNIGGLLINPGDSEGPDLGMRQGRLVEF